MIQLFGRNAQLPSSSCVIIFAECDAAQFLFRRKLLTQRDAAERKFRVIFATSGGSIRLCSVFRGSRKTFVELCNIFMTKFKVSSCILHNV